MKVHKFSKCPNPDCGNGYSKSKEEAFGFKPVQSLAFYAAGGKQNQPEPTEEEWESLKCDTCHGTQRVSEEFDFAFDGEFYNLTERKTVGDMLPEENKDYQVFLVMNTNDPDIAVSLDKVICEGDEYYSFPKAMN